jgi:hypothetical protein
MSSEKEASQDLSEKSEEKARSGLAVLIVALLIGLNILAGGLGRVRYASGWVGTVLQFAFGLDLILCGFLVFRLGRKKKATVLGTASMSVLLFLWMTVIFFEAGLTLGSVLSLTGLGITLLAWTGFLRKANAASGDGYFD